MRLSPETQTKSPITESAAKDMHSVKAIPWIPIIAAICAFFFMIIVAIAVFVSMSRKDNHTVLRKQAKTPAMQQQAHNRETAAADKTGTEEQDTVKAPVRHFEYNEGSPILKDLQLLPWLRSLRDYNTEGLTGVHVTCGEHRINCSTWATVYMKGDDEPDNLGVDISIGDTATESDFKNMEALGEFQGSLKDYLKRIRSEDMGTEWKEPFTRPALVQKSGNYKIKLYDLFLSGLTHEFNKLHEVHEIKYELTVIDSTNNEVVLNIRTSLQTDPDTYAFVDLYEDTQQIIRSFVQDGSIELPELSDIR